MKALFALLLLAVTARADGNVRIAERREPGTVYVYAQNAGTTRQTITFKLTGVANGSTDWPRQSVKQCLGGDSVLVAVLYQKAGAPQLTYTYTLATSDEAPPVKSTPEMPKLPVPPTARTSTTVTLPGDGAPSASPLASPPIAPEAKDQGSVVCRLPYKSGATYQVTQGYNGIQSHRGSFSLDFNMPTGTEVCAVMDGYVERAVDWKDGYSRDEDGGNTVILTHSNGTRSLYGHLMKGGVRVTRGQAVKAGEVIALSGNTGRSRVPHLHFALLRYAQRPEGEEVGTDGSIRSQFITTKSDSTTLHTGSGYTAS